MTKPPPPEASAESRPFTVTEITLGIKRLLERSVGVVEVEGEISNWTVSARGHAYFALKDDRAVLSCVLFRSSGAKLDFDPKDGMQAVVRGQVSVYEARGQYQLIVAEMRESGVGDLYRRFLELKEKLEKEGLFASERKRPLPPLPRRIGIVTSPSGAALRDIIHVIRRRSPCVELILAPTLVQGEGAAPRIVRAIARLNRFHAEAKKRKNEENMIDVMIVGRGGGSIEDLWAFNDEAVARAIFNSKVPVISAVGHETDFTIADFVADLRAPTPSAAAEVVVAEMSTLLTQVSRSNERLKRSMAQMLESRRLKLERLERSWGLRQPLDMVRQAIQRLDDLADRRERAILRIAENARHKIDSLTGRLKALDPRRVLERGYSIVSRARDGKVVTREKQVKVSDHVRIQIKEGELRGAILPRGDDFLDGADM